jgi:cytochrome c oxidase subunit IV
MSATAGFVLGARMREAVYINLGLLALKKCIEALNNKCDYVPYQVILLWSLVLFFCVLALVVAGLCRSSSLFMR